MLINLVVATTTPEASTTRRRQRLRNVNPENLLEFGLYPGTYQTLLVNRFCETTSPRAPTKIDSQKTVVVNIGSIGHI
ncbi:hypothetical protein BDQ94DRAFT_144163 [Aspergillus welwitschiae]|uniref:Uncharacterized protein n=1 Tax=Aspergillus welwitschiae TaxID=1341132 RepID=A0A3F3Q124_9EURO|nr:hypothetical protein BDQ94DRAFT_144163 [Aspergillus welwitschiae]RDH32924.1 hypothetical protein BDQ94DRAFT_144163 [Aspergillus welwitschiae]